MRTVLFAAFAAFLMMAMPSDIQAQDRPASPRGEAATQIGDDWLVVDYGRPILRSRTSIFGEGESYGEGVLANAEVWRAGANKSTRFMTERDLMFGNNHLPAGEYSLFVDLAADGWTLIVSSLAAKNSGREEGPGIWGAYNYTADMDVFRTAMMMTESPMSIDQFSIFFSDVTEQGGALNMAWENTIASVSFMAH
jgi:hypothetical protein